MSTDDHEWPSAVEIEEYYRENPGERMGSREADRAAFLRTICERPDDNTPRLIYADWLADHNVPEVLCPNGRGCINGTVRNGVGSFDRVPCDACHGTSRDGNQFEGRSEFIQAQCELTRPLKCEYSRLDTCFDRRTGSFDVAVSGCSNCLPVARLRLRADTLLGDHGGQWLQEEFALPEGWWLRGHDRILVESEPELAYLVWVGGFVSGVNLCWQSWLALYPVLTHPITDVILRDWPDAEWVRDMNDVGSDSPEWSFGIREALFFRRQKHMSRILGHKDGPFPGVTFTLPTEDD